MIIPVVAVHKRQLDILNMIFSLLLQKQYRYNSPSHFILLYYNSLTPRS